MKWRIVSAQESVAVAAPGLVYISKWIYQSGPSNTSRHFASDRKNLACNTSIPAKYICILNIPTAVIDLYLLSNCITSCTRGNLGVFSLNCSLVTMSACHMLSPSENPATRWTGDFWSKSVSLILETTQNLRILANYNFFSQKVFFLNFLGWNFFFLGFLGLWKPAYCA